MEYLRHRSAGCQLVQRAASASGRWRLNRAAGGAGLSGRMAKVAIILCNQLGSPHGSWHTYEPPSMGIRFFPPIAKTLPTSPPIQLNIATVFLQQQLPTEMTN